MVVSAGTIHANATGRCVKVFPGPWMPRCCLLMKRQKSSRARICWPAWACLLGGAAVRTKKGGAIAKFREAKRPWLSVGCARQADVSSQTARLRFCGPVGREPRVTTARRQATRDTRAEPSASAGRQQLRGRSRRAPRRDIETGRRISAPRHPGQFVMSMAREQSNPANRTATAVTVAPASDQRWKIPPPRP